ncbi:MAG: hypothetical protein V4693_24385 [Pseudomonadota bacterium]
MNKASFFFTVALCLSALTASAGPITQGASQGEPVQPGLHILAMSAAEQLDLDLWNRAVASARELPTLWEGAAFNGPVASVRSAPVGAPAADLTGSGANMRSLFAPGPSPFSFMLLAAGLALGSYTLRRTRISELAACG